MTDRRCSECGRKLDGLMTIDPSKPGFGGLLRGLGEDPLLIAVARLAGLLIVFAAACLAFWALALALP